MDEQKFIEWEPRFSVGNRVLDEQHKVLFNLCAKAETCAIDNSDKATGQFHEILNELARYVDIHFRTEEALLEVHGYPLTDQHKAEHDLYVENLNEILISASSDIIDKEGLRRHLSSWWSEHILGSDKEYAGFITGQSR